MYTVEYTSPVDDTVHTQKFKGKYASENAFSYAKRQYENYYMDVVVRGWETFKGKKSGGRFVFGAAQDYDSYREKLGA